MTGGPGRYKNKKRNTAFDPVPPVKTHVCLSNFYQLNGYSSERPTGSARDF